MSNPGALSPDANPRALCLDYIPNNFGLGGTARPKRLESDPSFYSF